MANILQVTTPNLNVDNRNMVNPQDPKHGVGNPAIHNPADPTRVVRSDGRDGEQTGNTAQDALFNVINYESNYGAFIKGLGEEGELAAVLERLLFSDMAAIKDAGQTEVAALVDKLMMTMKVDSPEDLLAFVEGQGDLQAKFTGDFFDKLRSILTQSSSQGLWESALPFLKAYNNYSSGAHLLQQMGSLTMDIEQLLLRSYQEEFRELSQSMDWQAANGNTAQNAQVLNKVLIPYLSRYISRTHDYGPIREATMHLVFHAARYQNGGKDRLIQLFENLAGNRDFIRLFKGEAREELERLAEQWEGQESMEESRKADAPEGGREGLEEILRGAGEGRTPLKDVGGPLGQMLREELEGLLKAGSEEGARQKPLSGFAEGLSQLVLKGANGQAGLENVQQFYTIMNGMLLNESVYMPLLHFIIPFQYEDKNVMSEMWIDPDSKREDDGRGRKVKMFLKFDIHNVGKFELVMTLQDRQASVQLFVPPHLAKEDKKIQTDVADILKGNGIRFGQLMVRQRRRDRRVDEIFPEIREKERTINVRI